MDCKELNIYHRNLFDQTVKVEHRIEWEDDGLIKILLGEMPHFYASNRDGIIKDEISKINLCLKKYNRFYCDKKSLLSKINEIYTIINEKVEYWHGYRYQEIEDYFNI